MSGFPGEATVQENEESPVGLRIRELRKRRGLTLRALAQRSGLSSNAISMIERGENSPTVSSLRQLASALKVPIVAFFQDAAEDMTVFVRRGTGDRSRSDATTIESLGSGLADQHLVPILVSLEPGDGRAAESYSHAGEEFVHCLEGAIEYRVGDRLYPMGPGDSLLFKASQIHGFRNLGDTRAVMTIVIDECEASSGSLDSAVHRRIH